MFSYLKFWFKSSNQHGLHSPFVYNYLTKGLYETQVLSSDKQLNWILKSIAYFKPNKIYACDALKEVLGQFQDIFTNSINNADLIFVQNDSIFKVNNIVMEMNSDQLLFVCNLKYDFELQSKLRSNNEIILVVDFYYGSLISKRAEQLKQNFFLRL